MSSLVLLAVSFVLGVALGLLAPTAAWNTIVVGIAGPALMLVSLRVRFLPATIACAACFLIGWSRVPAPAVAQPPPAACDRLVEGRIAAAPLRLSDRHRLTIELERATTCLEDGPVRGPLAPVSGKLLATVLGDDRPPGGRGDRVRFRGTIRPLSSPHNRGIPARPSRELLLTAIIPRAALIVRTTAAPPSILRGFDGIRAALADFWLEHLEPDQARLVRALTLGEASVLDPGQREAFRRTGTAHLVAVSGLHLGVVVLSVYWLLGQLLRRTPPIARRLDSGRLAAACAIPLAIGFAILTGARPPVVRATTMVVCALAARALGRGAGPAEAVALAAAGLLAYDPQNLIRPGFQLSFAAVLAFAVALRPPRSNRLALDEPATPRHRSAPRRILAGITALLGRGLRASLAATAATSPLVLYHFGRFSMVAVPANAVAVPITAFVLLPGFVVTGLLALVVPTVAAPLARALGAALSMVSHGLATIADLPTTIDNPGPLTAAAIYAGCVAMLLLAARRIRAGALVGICCAVVAGASLLCGPTEFPRGKLVVDFLDVGQADATLVTFPDGRHWLVDGAGASIGTYDAGRHLLVPALQGQGVRELDKLVLTHPDPDHVGGMPAVLERITVREVWDNGQGAAEGAHEAYSRLHELARRKGVPVRRTTEICGPRTVAGVRVRVLHPCHDPIGYDPSLSFNDNSIVLELRHGSTSLLLPGDLSREGEELLLEGGSVEEVDVLKLGHHGSLSSTSQALLEQLAPVFAVASSGARNRWGMPHRLVRQRLRRRGIPLFGTDRQGAVRVVLGTRTIAVSPVLPVGPR